MYCREHSGEFLYDKLLCLKKLKREEIQRFKEFSLNYSKQVSQKEKIKTLAERKVDLSPEKCKKLMSRFKFLINHYEDITIRLKKTDSGLYELENGSNIPTYESIVEGQINIFREVDMKGISEEQSFAFFIQEMPSKKAYNSKMIGKKQCRQLHEVNIQDTSSKFEIKQKRAKTQHHILRSQQKYYK